MQSRNACSQAHRNPGPARAMIFQEQRGPMQSRNKFLNWLPFVMAIGLAMTTSPAIVAQDKGVPFGDKELNTAAYVELLRSDIQKRQVAVIGEVMQLNDADSAKFWPIYRQYQSELQALNDTKIAVVRDYVKNYDNLTDQMADHDANTIFDFESKRVALKKKYYERMKNALSAKTAARFFQVENQILMLIDLQLASSLPAIR
jgi:hypothetical protein